MEVNSNSSNPVLSMITTRTITSLLATAGTQLNQTAQTLMPFSLTGIKILLISTCSLIRCSTKLNVGLAAYRRCLGPSLNLTCEIRRRLFLKWQVICPRYP